MNYWKETGWVCPNCKKVYSPYVDECKACNVKYPKPDVWGSSVTCEEPIRGNTVSYTWMDALISSALYETKTLTLP
jgi:hypothetical protein